jgi:hypothetical protein
VDDTVDDAEDEKKVVDPDDIKHDSLIQAGGKKAATTKRKGAAKGKT